MKTRIYYLFFASSVFTLQSCAAIGGIFKAGAAKGVIVVVLVIALIAFFMFRGFKK